MQPLVLTCTSCGKEYAADAPNFRCGDCDEPLELPLVQSGTIRQDGGLKQTLIGRYADFFPFEQRPGLSLGEGFTPLMAAPRLAEQLGVGELYLKNETMNPTWSFKDRGTMAGLHHAVQLGYRQIGTVSSGNMATSVAAYGARAGLRTFVLVQSTIASEKLAPIAIYGADLITVEGDYGELYSASLRIGEELGIYFINSDHPFRVEGSKTIAFEIAEQLDFNMPDYLVVPTSAGGNLRGVDKGLREFCAAGLIDRMPKLICAQSTGCSPIATAWAQSKSKISHFGPTDTIAHAIENPNPPSGNQALRLLQRNGGCAVAVTNQEIIAAQAELAQAGVFAQPASAVSVAAIRKLRSDGYLTGRDRIAAVITGSGLKYTAAFQHHKCSYSSCKLEQLRDKVKSLL
ncbi:MAG: threonine synthase [Bacillota bacterium]|jgi:threonine synthase